MDLREHFDDAVRMNNASLEAVKRFDFIASNDINNFGELSNLTIENCKKLTVTTCIKDRLIFFKKSLPNWLKFPL